MRRKTSGKYVFIPPKTHSDAKFRRNEVIKRINEIKVELSALEVELVDLREELGHLNRFVRGEQVQMKWEEPYCWADPGRDDQ